LSLVHFGVAPSRRVLKPRPRKREMGRPVRKFTDKET
jgi:hypothetical protein